MGKVSVALTMFVSVSVRPPPSERVLILENSEQSNIACKSSTCFRTFDRTFTKQQNITQINTFSHHLTFPASYEIIYIVGGVPNGSALVL